MTGTGKNRILLVEDESLIALSEKRQLEKLGYVVHYVLNGEDAVHSALKNEFEIVLMDVDLGPGLDGTQAAEKILKEKDVPIVFLSSHTEPEIVEKTEKITSYGYVVKNSGIVVLDASIKMALKLFESNVKQKEAEERLRESEEKFRSFIENANDIIYQLNVDGVFTYVSPNWTEMLGYELNDVIGEKVEKFVHTDDLQNCLDFLNLVITTGRKQSGVEYRVRHKNGSWRWHVSNGSPLKD